MDYKYKQTDSFWEVLTVQEGKTKNTTQEESEALSLKPQQTVRKAPILTRLAQNKRPLPHSPLASKTCSDFMKKWQGNLKSKKKPSEETKQAKQASV